MDQYFDIKLLSKNLENKLFLKTRAVTIFRFLFGDALDNRIFSVEDKNYELKVTDTLIAINTIIKNLVVNPVVELSTKNLLCDCFLNYNKIYQQYDSTSLDYTLFKEKFYDSFRRFLNILQKIDQEIFSFELDYFELDSISDLELCDELVDYWNSKDPFSF